MTAALVELDRWADDGGPAPVEPLTPADVGVLWADALGRFVRDLTEALQPVFDALRQVAEAIGAAWGRFTATLAAGRWRTDVLPRRWRDWLPSSEPKIDRARRERVDRAMRARARRAARHRRALR